MHPPCIAPDFFNSPLQLASGGNDNLLMIWDAGSDRPSHRITSHQAAVKALAWCPFQSNLLASGGGTADRSIKFWNTHTGALLNSIDTGSQVCALQWNRHEREILSSHGFRREGKGWHTSEPNCLPSHTLWIAPETSYPCRLQPEPAVSVEVPVHGQGGRDDGPHLPRPASGPVARRDHRGVGCC